MAESKRANLLVVASPASPELEVLKRLPSTVNVVATGQTLKDFHALTPEQWASIDVLLNCGVGALAGKKTDIQEFWPLLSGLKWMHSASAGLEHLLFPELVQSPVVLTNAKGVYSHSLAEYTLMAAKWFAMDMPRLLKDKQAAKWAPFDVEELRGKTLGIIGYGDIGRACGRLARAFKMRVVALRRRTELSEEEKASKELDHIYPPPSLNTLMAVSDYVVAATPYTEQTHKLVSASAIAAMKPTGVFINVGRGKCVDEEALIAALQQGKIRGAALDVFYTEPLPADSPLWGLDNVLMSPHCADRTKEFQFESLEFFLRNMDSYLSGEPLQNICDKNSGY